MPEATNASTAPVCAPVIRPVRNPRGLALPCVIARIDSAAERIHAGRSTTRAGGTTPSAIRPVTSRTGGSAFSAATVSSSITWRRVYSVDGGAGRASRSPTLAANSQSTVFPSVSSDAPVTSCTRRTTT
ncbi:Uncharacterised protein [Mycobacterium tuberculosis]|uniref:Uncharacterized protein n=1 Tax=Mycobacterium tuberculosis TaxID=1773 RepID=A0A655JL61_MYCTX|nr:Uncharacterised protein [Mycobacterium tuberculosis]CNL59625.1 Uncharacterised protein [Mycobacterium tuberculosis]CNL91160.1 Uncharacterised protein [Mycobacterium tuberculosis]CNL95502.1 Uncharacterised protein [Mycobacterium tuberculosis]CNM19442.1 Uncharacterised protein [Mycobacterium tuberculosis]